MVLLWDSIFTAGLSSGPNTKGSETKAIFNFVAWKSSDSSCKAEVSHPSVHVTPYTKYPKMPLQSHVRFHYDPWLQLFPFHFFCFILLRVLSGLVNNCPCQFSRSLPDFHVTKIQWLSLLSLPQESSLWLENSLWAVVLTFYHTSPLSLPFLQSNRNNSFVSSSTVLVWWRGRWYTWGC